MQAKHLTLIAAVFARQVSAFVLMLIVFLHPNAALAEAAAFVSWDDLAPSTEPYEDPFLEMSYKQKDDLRTILQASEAHSNPALTEGAQDARVRLRDGGYDADELLVRRLVVMKKRREEATGVTGEFLGREVLVDGYVLPLRWTDQRVHSFLLVPWVGACIHTPSPPPNQMIRVDVPEGIEIDQTFHAIRLRGVLEHRPSVSDLFLVDGRTIVEASYEMTGAQIWGEPAEIALASATLYQGNLFSKVQVWINNQFTTAMTSIDQGRSSGAVAFALLVAFLYGVLHTLGPGHGKAVVISYFVGEGGNLHRGVWMGCKIAVVHVCSAVVAVFLLDMAITQATGASASDYWIIRLSSYGLIVVIGTWMVWSSIASFRTLRRQKTEDAGYSGGHHLHHHHGATGPQTGCAACSAAARPAFRSDGWLATAVGIVPCTGALIVMLFGLANDLILSAIAMVAAISLGMAIAMSGIGIAAIWSRSLLADRIGESAAAISRFETTTRLAGAACVLLLGVFLFASTLLSPMNSSIPDTATATKIRVPEYSAQLK